jgi:hypothetical protein
MDYKAGQHGCNILPTTEKDYIWQNVFRFIASDGYKQQKIWWGGGVSNYLMREFISSGSVTIVDTLIPASGDRGGELHVL